MCRLILAQGRFESRAVLDAAVAMSCGRTADHDGPTDVHPNGWGAVWRDAGAVNGLGVHRDVRPLSESWQESPVPDLTTDFLAIHARHATLPQNHGIQFTHPLHREDELPWYFMHNGFLPTVHSLLGMESSAFDSREYFDYVIPAGADTLDAQRTRQLLDAIPPGGSSGNAIAVNPRAAYVIHWTSPPNKSPRYFTMQRLRTPDLTVISSEVIPDLAPADQWEPLEPGTVEAFSLIPAQTQLSYL
ncbi:class II glutamine amidotransferase [Streptomyces sp. NPDC051243]|uniref:class II glutamine amidotransferase n=1 Tax=Streptomyces sp. NPDC051243 TaxID=3365646 RepID=UPI0037A5197E